MSETEFSEEAPAESEDSRALPAEGRSGFDHHKVLKPGESHRFNTVTITYRRGVDASDAMMTALHRGGQIRSPLSRGWSSLDGPGKADFIAEALRVAAGVVTTA